MYIYLHFLRTNLITIANHKSLLHAAYLDAVLEDGDFEHILLALKNVAEAQQDFISNSKNNRLNLDTNSQQFPNQQTSELMTIAQLLNQLGLKLSVTVKERQPA